MPGGGTGLGATPQVVAVPVASPRSVAELRDEGWTVLVVETPPHFSAVSRFYASFPQVADDEVRALLSEADTRRGTNTWASPRRRGSTAPCPGGVKAIGSWCVLADVVRASKHAWAAVSDLRAIDREAPPGTRSAFTLEEALRATEELATGVEGAEVRRTEA